MAEEPAESLAGWVSISELARMRGVAKSAVSKRVCRLQEQGLLISRAGPHGTKLVNVAEFIRVCGETVDIVREANGARLVQPVADAPEALVYAREQTRATAIRADLAQLELDERLGKLVPVEEVERSTVIVAEAIVRGLQQMTVRAEEGAALVGRDGVHGMRAFLREEERRIREILARELRALAARAGDKHADADRAG